MAPQSTLRDEPLSETTVHLCVDVQRLFGPGTEWALPWLERVVPSLVQLCEMGPERTIFTRFIPARRPGQGQGTWRRYYTRWASMTLEEIGDEMVELLPELAAFVIDKPVYSPWLHRRLRERRCDTLVVSGGRDRHVRAGDIARGLRIRLPHDPRPRRSLQCLGRGP